MARKTATATAEANGTTPRITREAIAAEREARRKACAKAIEATLEEHSCALVPQITIVGNGSIQPSIDIVPKE